MKIPEITASFSKDQRELASEILGGAEFGTLVHKLLELNTTDISKLSFSKELSLELVAKAKELVSKYFTSPIHLLDAQYIKYREYKFSYYDANWGLSVVGVIDCMLLYADNSIGIIDYKTGRLDALTLSKYCVQLSLYAQIIEKIFKKPVKKLAIHHINEQREYLVKPENYQEAIAELIARIKTSVATNDFGEQTANCAWCTCNYYCTKTQGQDS